MQRFPLAGQRLIAGVRSFNGPPGRYLLGLYGDWDPADAAGQPGHAPLSRLYWCLRLVPSNQLDTLPHSPEKLTMLSDEDRVRELARLAGVDISEDEVPEVASRFDSFRLRHGPIGAR